MKKKMHIISVNKGPLALAFPSLMEISRHNKIILRFSGTVGGGTPILNYAKIVYTVKGYYHFQEYLMELQIIF